MEAGHPSGCPVSPFFQSVRLMTLRGWPLVPHWGQRLTHTSFSFFPQKVGWDPFVSFSDPGHGAPGPGRDQWILPGCIFSSSLHPDSWTGNDRGSLHVLEGLTRNSYFNPIQNPLSQPTLPALQRHWHLPHWPTDHWLGLRDQLAFRNLSQTFKGWGPIVRMRKLK